MMLQLLFWASLAGVGYIYFGYPLLMTVLGRRFHHPVRRGQHKLSVSVLVVGHNEAENLRRKIAGLLRSDSLERIQEIVIASDGSDDDTPMVVESFQEPRLRLLSFAERRGKPAVLNDAIPRCRGDIVVLMDSRQEIPREAVGNLIAGFADPDVGVISGELVFREPDAQTTAAEGIGFYWKYEKWIRRHEAMFRSVPGATGAFYAIRRELFRPIPADTLLDDVAIPMQIIQQGKRCVFEGSAVAYDKPSRETGQEAIRKRRTIAGNAQLLRHHPQWLLPWRNRIWLEFMSHKIFRLFSPLLLLIVLVTNCLLLELPLYQSLLMAQAGFYLAAGCGYLVQRAGRRSRLLGPLLMFVSLNLTTLLALWDASRGRYRVTWKRAT